MVSFWEVEEGMSAIVITLVQGRKWVGLRLPGVTWGRQSFHDGTRVGIPSQAASGRSRPTRRLLSTCREL